MFSSLVTDHWLPSPASAFSDDDAVVVVDPEAPENRSVSILRIGDGATVVSLSPERADQLGVSDGERLAADEVLERIDAAGIALNDPDHLFYLPVEEHANVTAPEPQAKTRRLTAEDADAFAALVAAAPEDELDEAFVELDHWLVFGTFVDGTLAAAASMYPWKGTRLADLGVITLPEFRGRGLARATVLAMAADALERGYEPQYRCQLDNAPSVALALASGFRRFGEWIVVDD
ncbi:GNAT superfamily N-acetyltransferase [Microbacterium testaceum]|uniref:GNAT family N-acetyltransferase n=1 Tax=Microbacterium TaxID=33882 RepID=UPI00277E4EBC|nr:MULTISPECIES: GNAT family N-acetyltransferase [Microbacterium]MDQ1110712.1 GNAT superfamily N-acetyltransferase [Microbacterium testaceum]MDR6098743.1 GNAT superfamily N-acetyltransferase [Microbacterium sp. SORGH_AS_0454]